MQKEKQPTAYKAVDWIIILLNYTSYQSLLCSSIGGRDDRHRSLSEDLRWTDR